MSSRYLSLLAALVVFIGGRSYAQDALPPETIDVLIAQSGMGGQLEQLPKVFGEIVKQSLTGVKQGQIARLQEAVANAYAADRMRPQVREHLRATLTPEDVEAAMRWLSSPLGKKVTELEKKSSTPEAFKAIQAMASESAATVRPERMKQLERFAAALDKTEKDMLLLKDMKIAIAEGMARASGQDSAVAAKHAENEFEAMRAQLEPDFRKKAILSLAYTYHDLTDEELGQYIDFAESPPARRFHSATTDALYIAMAKATKEVGVIWADLNKAELTTQTLLFGRFRLGLSTVGPLAKQDYQISASESLFVSRSEFYQHATGTMEQVVAWTQGKEGLELDLENGFKGFLDAHAQEAGLERIEYSTSPRSVSGLQGIEARANYHANGQSITIRSILFRSASDAWHVTIYFVHGNQEAERLTEDIFNSVKVEFVDGALASRRPTTADPRFLYFLMFTGAIAVVRVYFYLTRRGAIQERLSDPKSCPEWYQPPPKGD